MFRRAAGGYQHKIPTKVSYGIILCRKAENNRPEVLLAHKRYTYAFADFIHGRYTKHRNGLDATLSGMMYMFDQMTCEELLDIYSLKFDQMWYRVWLNENKELYNKKNAKFQSVFMQNDSGESLRRFIMKARSSGVLLWEAPKGRKKSSYESELLCAIREFGEETGVDKGSYKLVPGVKRKVSYVSCGVRYICNYYVALATKFCSAQSALSSKPTLSKVNTMGEISEVKWFDIEKIRLIDNNKCLESLIKPAFKSIRQFLNGYTRKPHLSFDTLQ